MDNIYSKRLFPIGLGLCLIVGSLEVWAQEPTGDPAKEKVETATSLAQAVEKNADQDIPLFPMMKEGEHPFADQILETYRERDNNSPSAQFPPRKRQTNLPKSQFESQDIQFSSPVVLDVLDLKNTDVADVFKLISQKSGLNIVAGQNVQGRITVYLRDIEVKEALRVIVEANGWAFVQDGSILKVITNQEYELKYGHKFGRAVQTRISQLLHTSPTDLKTILDQMKTSVGNIIADEKSHTLILIDEPNSLDKMQAVIKQMDVPVESKVFQLSYAKAEDLSGPISEVLTPAVGDMKFDVRSNKIVVSDTATKLKEVTKIIEAFDEKEKEVLIEARILQVILSDQHELGVDWEAVVSEYRGLNLKNTFDILSDGEKRGELSIGTLATDGYTALVQALNTVGETEILSSPRIAAINNKEAKILVGSTEPYVTTTTTTPASGPTTVAESVNFIEVGVKLYVTPTIHEDDFITMNIKPEISTVTSNLTTSNNNTIPIVETSEAETTVMVKDAVTIVIGGLIKEENIKTTKQIPFLGRIPILGNVFRSVDDLDKKTEIVIFLTPRIISGDIPDPEQLAVY